MYEGTAAKRFNIEDTHGIIFLAVTQFRARFNKSTC